MLRTQLKETRFRSEQEHQQKIKEWIDKTNVQRKEINALRSQLDFKVYMSVLLNFGVSAIVDFRIWKSSMSKIHC